jgi:hypothetical protein
MLTPGFLSLIKVPHLHNSRQCHVLTEFHLVRADV